jgi:hypothetical protein
MGRAAKLAQNAAIRRFQEREAPDVRSHAFVTERLSRFAGSLKNASSLNLRTKPDEIPPDFS